MCRDDEAPSDGDIGDDEPGSTVLNQWGDDESCNGDTGDNGLARSASNPKARSRT